MRFYTRYTSVGKSVFDEKILSENPRDFYPYYFLIIPKKDGIYCDRTLYEIFLGLNKKQSKDK